MPEIVNGYRKGYREIVGQLWFKDKEPQIPPRRCLVLSCGHVTERNALGIVAQNGRGKKAQRATQCRLCSPSPYATNWDEY